MGFLDKAKAAADDLSQKANASLSGMQAKKDTNALFHDLGMLMYRQALGEPLDEAEYNRIMGELQAAAQHGPLDMAPKSLPQPAPPPPGGTPATGAPPPPGAAAAPPPPGAATAPPPPGAATPPPPPAPTGAPPPPAAAEPPPAPAPQPAATPPPPPPSWASDDQNG